MKTELTRRIQKM